MLAASYCTTLPTEPEFVCVIFSSTWNVPGVPENLTALVALNVVTVAAEPEDFGSLINATLLKSF